MTVIARRVCANPVRTTGDTWKLITKLICAADDSMRPQLDKVANLAAMLIAEEHTRSNPIIVSGCGPHVRIYTLHDEAAVDGADANEATLLLNASEKWEVSLPANGDDYEFASVALSDIGHITVYDATKDPCPTTDRRSKSASRPLNVDLSILEN